MPIKAKSKCIQTDRTIEYSSNGKEAALESVFIA